MGALIGDASGVGTHWYYDLEEMRRNCGGKGDSDGPLETVFSQANEAIVSMTTAYCRVLALLVSGERLDPTLSDKLMDLVKDGSLPFHSVTGGGPVANCAIMRSTATPLAMIGAIVRLDPRPTVWPDVLTRLKRADLRG
jgi:hypothetical protein